MALTQKLYEPTIYNMPLRSKRDFPRIEVGTPQLVYFVAYANERTYRGNKAVLGFILAY